MGASIGMTTAGSWFGGRWLRLWCGRCSLKCVTYSSRTGVSLVVDQDPVGALLPDAADESFRVAVRSRCTRRNLDHGNALTGEHRVEALGESRVPVTDQNRNDVTRSPRSITRFRAC